MRAQTLGIGSAAALAIETTMDVLVESPRPVPTPDRPRTEEIAPLTAALLQAAGVTSFATPGHRAGRSCRWTR